MVASRGEEKQQTQASSPMLRHLETRSGPWFWLIAAKHWIGLVDGFRRLPFTRSMQHQLGKSISRLKPFEGPTSSEAFGLATSELGINSWPSRSIRLAVWIVQHVPDFAGLEKLQEVLLG